MIVADIVVMMSYAGFARYMNRFIKSDRLKYFNRFTGFVLVAIGLSIAFQMS
tara:strand:- start:796 stop:951 length:156 start_codon:yes stop_codon:yes gene_type:complete